MRSVYINFSALLIAVIVSHAAIAFIQWFKTSRKLTARDFAQEFKATLVTLPDPSAGIAGFYKWIITLCVLIIMVKLLNTLF